MEKLTKEQYEQMTKDMLEAEARIIQKLKDHMKKLSKDKKLKEETAKELGIAFKT